MRSRGIRSPPLPGPPPREDSRSLNERSARCGPARATTGPRAGTLEPRHRGSRTALPSPRNGGAPPRGRRTKGSPSVGPPRRRLGVERRGASPSDRRTAGSTQDGRLNPCAPSLGSPTSAGSPPGQRRGANILMTTRAGPTSPEDAGCAPGLGPFPARRPSPAGPSSRADDGEAISVPDAWSALSDAEGSRAGSGD